MTSPEAEIPPLSTSPPPRSKSPSSSRHKHKVNQESKKQSHSGVTAPVPTKALPELPLVASAAVDPIPAQQPPATASQQDSVAIRYISGLDSNSRIKLDVGGVFFTTTLSTLNSEPDSMLSTMFSGRYPIEMDEDMRIFIDRDGRYFQHVLNWLRNKKVPSGLNREEIDSLLVEAEYYALKDFSSALKSKKKELQATKTPMCAETKVITIVNSWSSFPGINIDHAQQRIQHTIDEYEKDGWMFVTSTTESCKSRLDNSTNVSTHVNLMHLFFKKLM